MSIPPPPVRKAMTRKEFAALLGISYSTLKRRIADLEDSCVPSHRLLTPRCQDALLRAFGYESGARATSIDRV